MEADSNRRICPRKRKRNPGPTIQLPAKVGEALPVPGGYVRKKGRNEYVIVVGERSRWGKAAEIRADLAHLSQHGALPGSGRVVF